MTAVLHVASPAVRQVLPATGPVDVDDVITRLRAAPSPSPFAEEVIDFCAAFATRLRRSSGSRPEAQALAYWMRAAELRRLAKDFSALADQRTVLAPQLPHHGGGRGSHLYARGHL